MKGKQDNNGNGVKDEDEIITKWIREGGEKRNIWRIKTEKEETRQ